MSEKEKKLAEDIMGIFERLPDGKRQRLLGVAEGMEMASTVSQEQGDASGEGDPK